MFVHSIIKNRLYLEVFLSYLLFIKFELSIVWDSVFWIQIILFSPVGGERCVAIVFIHFESNFIVIIIILLFFSHTMLSPDTIFVVLTKGIRE